MLEGWIERYGYLAVFIGALLEGETVLILAGYSVARDYLAVGPTFLLAAAGGTLSDSVYYWIGRHFGARFVRSRRSLRPYRARAVLLLRRTGHAAAFLNRFAYGLRVLLPMVMGAVRMRPHVFHVYNLAGSLCFAAVYLGLGYLFGEAADELIARLRTREAGLVMAIALLGGAAWLAREWWIIRSGTAQDARSRDD